MHTDAVFTEAEEGATCYLQIVLADDIPGFRLGPRTRRHGRLGPAVSGCPPPGSLNRTPRTPRGCLDQQHRALPLPGTRQPQRSRGKCAAADRHFAIIATDTCRTPIGCAAPSPPESRRYLSVADAVSAAKFLLRPSSGGTSGADSSIAAILPADGGRSPRTKFPVISAVSRREFTVTNPARNPSRRHSPVRQSTQTHCLVQIQQLSGAEDSLWDSQHATDRRTQPKPIGVDRLVVQSIRNPSSLQTVLPGIAGRARYRKRRRRSTPVSSPRPAWLLNGRSVTPI